MAISFAFDRLKSGVPGSVQSLTHVGELLFSSIDEIVAGWIDNRDEPGDWTFESTVLGTDGDLAFIQGVTDYRAANRPLYHNLWVVRLADDGRAREFTEWYMTPDD